MFGTVALALALVVQPRTDFGVRTQPSSQPVSAGKASAVAAAGEGSFSCTVHSVTDGDTLRCVERGSDGRAIRVRLSGIAARERDGSCTVGHPCPSASAEASTAALERLVSGQILQCRAVGSTYARVAAFCRAGSTDLSCAMVQGSHAAKWERYWGNHRCR